MPSGFVTTSQFAQQYGASPAVIAGIENYLEGFGINATAMSDNLVIQTTGTAGQYNQAFQVVQSNFKVNAPLPHGGSKTMVVHGTTQSLKMPSLWTSSRSSACRTTRRSRATWPASRTV